MGTARHAGTGRKADPGQALTVDLQALFAELDLSPDNEPRALSAKEVAKILKCSIPIAREKIRAAMDAGKAKAVDVKRVCLDRRVRTCTAYVFEV